MLLGKVVYMYSHRYPVSVSFPMNGLGLGLRFRFFDTKLIWREHIWPKGTVL
jgi:hypothetical protein